ncbi:MAG: PAS domain S-box protein [Desulfobacterales bacterium]|nr:PAS domain S-box protein [Desulfobacterales bacterium]
MNEIEMINQKLQTERDNLKQYLDLTGTLFVVLDAQGNVNLINTRGAEILGYSVEEIIGKSWFDHFLPPGIKDDIQDVFGLLMNGQVDPVRTYESSIITRNGKVKIIEWHNSVIKDENGHVCGIIGSGQDMTEKKELELKMIQLNMDLEQRIAYRTLELRMTNEKLSKEIIQRKRAEEKLNNAYLELEKSHDTLKNTMVQLVQTEKMAALGELTASVAHEMNQPLNVMKIIAQTMLRDIQKNRFEKEQVQHDIKDIISQVDRMAKIIDHMRVYTRRTDGMVFEELSINTIIENTLLFLSQQVKNHGIDLELSLTPDVPYIQGDAIRLEQVLVNLISNAKNAVEQSQRSTKLIDIRTCVIDGIDECTNEKKQWVILEVKDNGHGIPSTIKEKIFQPFFTTKEPGKGTGLGLHVVNTIIQEHGGKIEIESTEGEGSTFRVMLPAR